MHKHFFIFLFIFLSANCFAQKELKNELVKVSCGQCQFGVAGNSCDLAIKYKRKVYFVDSTHIDKHGDSHADDGFCNAVRKAKVSGSIVNGRFVVRSFELLPVKKG